MRHRLSLRRASVVKGIAGAPMGTAFAEYLQVWGEVCDLTATQGFIARQATSEITTIIRVRFRTGIMPNDRIYWNVNSTPATGTVAAPGVDAAATSIPMNNIGGYPSAYPFLLSIEGEIVRVDGVSGSNFSVTRGYAGTVAASHAAGSGASIPSLRIFSVLAVRDEAGLRKFLAIDCKELSNGS
jgi:head-tail adaptor